MNEIGRLVYAEGCSQEIIAGVNSALAEIARLSGLVEPLRDRVMELEGEVERLTRETRTLLGEHEHQVAKYDNARIEKLAALLADREGPCAHRQKRWGLCPSCIAHELRTFAAQECAALQGALETAKREGRDAAIAECGVEEKDIVLVNDALCEEERQLHVLFGNCSVSYHVLAHLYQRLRAEVERLTREMHELLQTHHEGCQAKFAQMEAVLRAVNVVLDECDLRLLGEDSEEGEKTARAIEGLYQARAAYRGRA